MPAFKNDRVPLLYAEESNKSSTTQWVIGLGVLSALCVAATAITTVNPDAKYAATATPTTTAAVSSVQAATLRGAAQFPAQRAQFTAGMAPRAAPQYAQSAQGSYASTSAPSWLPTLLVPLSALLGALAYKVVSKKPEQPLVVSMAAATGEKDMKVWNPIDNKKFETFSYLPLMTDAQIAKQVQMIIAKGLSPCLEFAAEESSFVSNENTVRFTGSAAGYYDNRYWTMWKLPMFGCTDASQVLREIEECKRAYPSCYVRLAAFDSVKQVQVMSFLVQKPGQTAAASSSTSYWAMAGTTGEKDMKVWTPIDNQKFETFSYLPPLSDGDIAKQVDFIIRNGLSPCLEFASKETSTVSNDSTVRFTGSAAGYYDNRYWTMWKLPMFGCTDASQVLNEVAECRRAYPSCYIRLAAFDSVKQVQVISFLVHQPGATTSTASSSTSYWAMAGTTGEKDMKVWNPIDNKKYETFSYLPELTDAQIAKQVQMIITNGLSPCLEFSAEESSFVSNDNTVRFTGSAAGYYDNRYWTMWKLPMFGCTDASQVLHEVNECRKAYPKCYIRLAAFDSVKQVQVMSFLVQKPGQTAAASSSTSYWAMAGTTGEKDMKVWNPIDNKKYETFSYLPALTDAQIAKQVDMTIRQGLSPCLEFSAEESSFVSNDNTVRFTGSAAGYYDNRYWTMWKLPMFGCTDASQVLHEVAECRRAYPDCYIRLAAFDSVKQVQVISFLVQKPGKVATWAVTGEKEMKVWNPIDNKKFETFSYLPLMTDAQIAKQVQMIIAKGLSPCLEFAAEESSFVSNENTVRFTGSAAGYYDNRYWTMWKLPMFGCTDASQVLREIEECKRAYPSCYVRLAAFDSVKQVQVMSFLVQKPGQTAAASSSTSYWAMAGTTGEKDMKVWTPIDNQKFETFSYLPPLSDGDIAKQVDFIIRNGLSPCLEFASKETSTVSNDSTVRFTGSAAGYYDNRYWTMWKLPMFGCTDASQVLNEVAECRRAYPSCYIRLAAFDSVKQVQVISFLVHQPGATTSTASSSTSYWAMAGTTGEKDMKVWNPIDNKKYETFSYLPELTDAQIAKQVQMIITNGLSPCLEFSAEESSFVSNDNTVRFTGSAAGYYDNRYWTMWKLPMFGCTDASQVLHEVNECRKAYPKCYIRLAAFDSVKQVQVMSFLVQKPGQTAAASSSTSYWAMAGTTGEKDMKVWNPIDNKKYETFSYLPALTDAQIAKQVDMTIRQGLSPCLEFSAEESSFVSNDNTVRFTGSAAGYYDNRYWTMWKLPMFGCTDASQVLHEVAECRRAYPDCYIRLAAFDSVKQVQVISFLVQKPGKVATWAVTGEKEMKVWNPIDNKKFETFSYLPLMTDAQIAKQVQMIIAKGLSPCLEFAAEESSFVSNENTVRFTGSAAGYYDNRYWTMWKLPMFGCTDASQVLREIEECKRAYPSCYVRLAAFDSVKQVQVMSFLVQKPGQTAAASSSTSYWAMAGTTGEKDMKVWTPIDNQKFETFSYLPPLSDGDIAKQVDFIIRNGLSPCLEFASKETSTVSNDSTVRFTGSAAGYYDNRYWTMWKLPMFGCTDASQVLNEVAECRRAYPSCYIRLAAFDSVKQVQVISFLVHQPGATTSTASSSTSYW